MVRRRGLPAVAAVLLVAGPLLTLAPAAAALEPDSRIVRAPLFGLAVETSAGGDTFSLVRIEGDGEDPSRTTLFAGEIGQCEERRLELLTKRHGEGNLNIPFPTLGGKQVWADQFIGCGWRVQRDVLTGHSRLLDPGDVRRAWGTYEQCRIEYERRRIAEKLVPRSSHLVLLIHGLFRSKDSFRRMAAALEARGFAVEAVNYPSTRKSIRGHSEQLAALLDRLEGYGEVSFVTHSLGGIIVRDLLSREGAWKEKVEVGRLVMLGPPNRGSVVAEMLQDWLPYRAVAGKAAVELTPKEMARIPPPSCRFGIIAGGTGTANGFNPTLGGDNDGTVLVRSTQLESAADFLRVRCLHSFLMNHEEAIEATGRFLETGTFRP